MDQGIYRIESELQGDNDESMHIHCEDGRYVKPEDDADERVLSAVENALSDSFLKLFYRYPNTREGDGKKIDLVAVSADLGVHAISVFDFSIEEIESITNQTWTIEDRGSIAAVREARSAEQSLKRQFEKRDELLEGEFDPDLRADVQGFIALPNIEQKEFVEQFDLPERVLQRIIFSNHLDSTTKLQSRLTVTQNSALPDKVLRHVLAVLKFSDLLSGSQLNVVDEPQTKGEVAKTIQNRLKCITDEQFKIGFEHPDDPQRIRGIAGSGKTVVMALKAAIIHYQEDWDICVTFRNHGLYQTHRNLIIEFYKALSGGSSPDWGDSLELLHGWGNKDRNGMYRRIALANGADFFTSPQASDKFNEYNPAMKLEKVCEHLLNTTDISPQYDAILIDEGQDFTPSFYQMCRDALTDEQRLYWAADEAQNLSTLQARDLKTLFGTDENGELDIATDVSEGFISGGLQGTHVMDRSFRTPRSILMTAHAFGMGLYRDDPIRAIRDQEQWGRLGYEVTEGNFLKKNVGEPLRLERPARNSPHPLTQVEPNRDETIYPLLKTHWADTSEGEARWVAKQIDRDLKSGLSKDDLMIIYFWPPSVRDQAKRTLFEEIRKHSEQIENNHDAIHQVGDTDRAEFRKPGKISLTQVHYARGNESPVVYLMGLEYISKSGYDEYMSRNSNWHGQYLGARNEAFVGLSRTLAWCRVSGHGEHDSAFHELEDIYRDTDCHKPHLTYPAPEPNAEQNDPGPMAIQRTLPTSDGQRDG
ncbi:DEAD/DEAH box helicase [Haloplanus sp. C73]|uniref:DEAD/DEAH box helicase n=1 Tax=Haloplanus sp. C73 TaxID=3421641 RepID=UPI003EBCDB05